MQPSVCSTHSDRWWIFCRNRAWEARKSDDYYWNCLVYKIQKIFFWKFLQFFATIVYWIYWRMDQYAGVSLLAFIAPGVPTQSFTSSREAACIDGWMHGWMERGRSFGAQKTMFFGNISKMTQDFFRSVSRPLRRVFNTSFVKISKKKHLLKKESNIFLKIFSIFTGLYYWRFDRFFRGL